MTIPYLTESRTNLESNIKKRKRGGNELPPLFLYVAKLPPLILTVSRIALTFYAKCHGLNPTLAQREFGCDECTSTQFQA
jgi:hypothetical protein